MSKQYFQHSDAVNVFAATWSAMDSGLVIFQYKARLALESRINLEIVIKLGICSICQWKGSPDMLGRYRCFCYYLYKFYMLTKVKNVDKKYISFIKKSIKMKFVCFLYFYCVSRVRCASIKSDDQMIVLVAFESEWVLIQAFNESIWLDWSVFCEFSNVFVRNKMESLYPQVTKPSKCRCKMNKNVLCSCRN